MIDKKRLLEDLIQLRDLDRKIAKEARTQKEKDVRTGSLITLESVIDFIKEGEYDIKKERR